MYQCQDIPNNMKMARVDDVTTSASTSRRRVAVMLAGGVAAALLAASVAVAPLASAAGGIRLWVIASSGGVGSVSLLDFPSFGCVAVHDRLLHDTGFDLQDEFPYSYATWQDGGCRDGRVIYNITLTDGYIYQYHLIEL